MRKVWSWSGQITVFVLMIFMLVVSVLAVQYKSALYYACRSDADLAARMSVDSFLATYQVALRDRYGLLAVDGGYGQSEFLQQDMESNLLSIYKNNLQSSLIKNQIQSVTLVNAPIFSYFIDGDWEFLLREIKINQKEQMIIEGVDYILSQWGLQNSKAEGELTQKRQIAENTVVETEQNTEDENNEIQQDVRDPRDLLMNIWNQGILKAACPSGFSVSEKTSIMSDVSYPEAGESVRTRIDFKNDASVYQLFSEWKNILKPQNFIDLVSDDLMVQSYISDRFTNAMSSGENTEEIPRTLDYEMEYLISGCEEDHENLKNVLWKLLAIRCVLNLSYLLSSVEKGNQVMITAAALSSVLMIPQFVEVVAFVLKMAWAFAESLADCRTLLSGGSIPLIKTDQTWYLDWGRMTNLSTNMLDGNKSKEGLSYEAYLQIMMTFTDRDVKYRRMTHLMEKNIRMMEGYEGFRMKNCIYGIQVEYSCDFRTFGTYNTQIGLSY